VRGVITLRKAVKDYLREQGISLEDLLDAMDESLEGVIESLMKRVSIDYKDALELEKNYGTRQLNLLIFAIQVFYLMPFSGYYKGYLIIPTREEVLNKEGKVSKNGLYKIIRSLGLKPRWASFSL